MGGRGAIAAAAVIMAVVLSTAAPAHAADAHRSASVPQGGTTLRMKAATYVELNPETVQAGYLVGIRASCDDNTKPATVESGAFGEVRVYPQFDVLTAAVTVPAERDARRYEVRLSCEGGGSATARLNVLPGGRPSEGPATGFGGMAGDGSGGLLVGGGVVAIAVGALLGAYTLRRRRAETT
ncbi:hypothetical protein [Phytohabitans kaempferiae]|uniref:Lipoprotein n=1 Tax=Phytohabitans kaempferiae TaxID=1620943 RepID=A0ABV6LXA3_9ACTN